MNFTDQLRSRKMSHTKSRIRLLEVMYDAGIPLSVIEIERAMPGECNRTTIYRNLTALSDKGMVQRIFAGEFYKYKLLLGVNDHEGNGDHVHFKCTYCQRVLCMEELQVKDYPLPEGFRKLENQFLIMGLCNECNHK